MSARRRSLVWAARALADLEEIGEFIARDSGAAAERWIGVLLAAAERAARLPMAGRRVPELGRDDLRELIQRNYRVVYRVQPTRVVILTIFERHRLLPPDVGERNEPPDPLVNPRKRSGRRSQG